MNPEDFKAAVLAMCDYAMDDKDPDTDGVAKAILIMAKPVIDSNNQKYKNGTKGGRPKNQTKTKPKPNQNQTETKAEPYVDVDVEEDVEVEEKDEEDVKVSGKRKQSKREVEIIPTYAEDPILNATIVEFLDYRKQMKSTMSDIAVTKMLAKLDKIGKSDHERYREHRRTDRQHFRTGGRHGGIRAASDLQ